MLGFNWWTRFDWTMAIDFLSRPQKQLSIQGACSKRVNYPRLKLRPCWTQENVVEWMSHEQELNLGELESELGFCRTQTIFAFGSWLRSGAQRGQVRKKKHTEENKKRTWGGVCSVYVIWQQVTERQRHRQRETMTVLIRPETETRHY